jgi:hypothetical protein
MQLLLHSPKDLTAAMFASAAVVAIISNALFMQAGRHPSPLFSASVAVPTAAAVPVLPRPRPIEALARPSDAKPGAEARSVDAKLFEPRAIDAPAAAAKPAAVPAPAPATVVVRPPAAVPTASRNDPLGDLIVTSRRVASVQRALTDYGYGQLKPTGNVGSETQAAIQRFERDRKLPVTGQMSDRLVRELSVVTGRPID